MSIIFKTTIIHTIISFLLWLPLYKISNISFIHMIIQYYGVALIAYIVHRTSHDLRKPRFWYNAHVIGHQYRNYPPNRFDTEKYIFKTDNLLKEADTYVYPIPILLYLILYSKYILNFTFLIFLVNLSLIILHFYAEVYIHEQVHLKKSWLDKYKIYQEIKRLHLMHHQTMHKNILFTNFVIDKMLGTYKD